MGGKIPAALSLPQDFGIWLTGMSRPTSLLATTPCLVSIEISNDEGLEWIGSRCVGVETSSQSCFNTVSGANFGEDFVELGELQ